jgi:DNA replication protein DnaC
MPETHTLSLLLKQLNLSYMSTHWESETVVAEQTKWSYGQYLSSLCSKEASLRHQKRIERQIKVSHLPPGKTLDTFDFKALPYVKPAQINNLSSDPDWVKQARNLVIFGPSGVGKTHLAAAIGYRLIEKGIKVCFTQTTALVQKLQQAHQAYQLPEALAKLSRIPLLILDDMGYVKKNEAETSVLFELIASRYENQSLIVTANQPFSEWGQLFPDRIMAIAAIDRLVHHATIISIDGQSYRKKQQLKQ